MPRVSAAGFANYYGAVLLEAGDLGLLLYAVDGFARSVEAAYTVPNGNATCLMEINERAGTASDSAAEEDYP